MRRLFKFLRVTRVWIILLPYLFFGLGLVSNDAVLIANHGKFPVMFTDHLPNVDGMYDDQHCVMTGETKLNALGDIFDYGSATASVGDIMLDIGRWLRTICFYIWLTMALPRLYWADSSVRQQ